MKMVEVVLSCISERLVTLKARRDIVPFEQLRFDYGDKIAQALFDDSSSKNFGFSLTFKLVLGTFYQFSNQFRIYNNSHFLFTVL